MMCLSASPIYHDAAIYDRVRFDACPDSHYVLCENNVSYEPSSFDARANIVLYKKNSNAATQLQTSSSCTQCTWSPDAVIRLLVLAMIFVCTFIAAGCYFQYTYAVQQLDQSLLNYQELTIKHKIVSDQLYNMRMASESGVMGSSWDPQACVSESFKVESLLESLNNVFLANEEMREEVTQRLS